MKNEENAQCPIRPPFILFSILSSIILWGHTIIATARYSRNTEQCHQLLCLIDPMLGRMDNARSVNGGDTFWV